MLMEVFAFILFRQLKLAAVCILKNLIDIAQGSGYAALTSFCCRLLPSSNIRVRFKLFHNWNSLGTGL